MDNTEWAVKLSKAVEQAFMAGYRDGYYNAMNDATNCEWGHGSSQSTKDNKKAQAWQGFLDDPDW